MITPSFGLTATERVLPKLALDFTTASLDSRITFTRTTDATHPATYVNSNGYVAAATNNSPRFDYDPVTLACKGLLIEESRTNSLTYSEQFGNAAWTTLINASISTDSAVSPDGTANADKLIANTTSASHYVGRGITLSTTAYTYSVYAKAGGLSWIALEVYDAGAKLSYFDLANGVTGSNSTGNTSTITAVGNGWYRCTLTRTIGAAGNDVAVYLASGNESLNFAGNNSNGVYLWGAQLEAGTFATSYIPTTTTALTRNADVSTMTGTNFSDWFNASEGTFVIQFQKNVGLSAANNVLLDATAGATFTERIVMQSDANNFVFYVRNASGVQMNYSSANVAGNSKLAIAYKLNNSGGAKNSTLIGPDTSCAMPTGVDRLSIGTNYTLNQPMNGWMQKMYYYPQRLLGVETQAFTK